MVSKVPFCLCPIDLLRLELPATPSAQTPKGVHTDYSKAAAFQKLF
jgi:hypothetical protein